MLRFLKLSSRSQSLEVFKSFNPNESTWLVSDLRTKFELQEILLEKQGFFIDESVLRASDLWKLLIRRSEPRLRVVSDAFLRSLVRSIIDESAAELGDMASTAEETLFHHLDQMAAIIFHPEGTQMLEAWFADHPESAARWKSWFLRARYVGIKLINEHRVLSQRWIVSWLQNNSNLENIWQKPLVVDLGGELSRVEAEILRAISRYIDVTVLAPEPSWKNEFKYLLSPYEWLESQAQEVKSLPANQNGGKTFEPLRKVKRFSGMLAEVKEAVSSTRKWLEMGLQPREIVIVAPDIEKYWPVLSQFFKEEGIPVNKATTVRLQSLPDMARWLSHLRVRSGGSNYLDLELSFYDQDSAQKVRFEKFKGLFYSLYSTEDFSRHELVKSIYEGQFSTAKILQRDEFVGQTLLYWNGVDEDPLQLVLREILANALPSTKLSWAEWMKYLESVVATKEWALERPYVEGVQVTKIMSVGNEGLKKRVFLGLTEEQLKRKSKLQLSPDEYFELSKDLGFVISNPDVSDLEFELRWMSDDYVEEDVFCVGLTDFMGQLQTPAKFWLSLDAQRANHVLEVPEFCRLDELQKTIEPDKISSRLKQDLGFEEMSSFVVDKSLSYSPSAFSSYVKCPFVFAAERVFNLVDEAEIDIDVDPRSKGSLFHSIFESLTAEPFRSDWSDNEIIQIIDEGRQKTKMVIASEELWPSMRGKVLMTAKRFLENEKSLRQKFPQKKVFARELKLNLWFNPRTKEVSIEEKSGFVKISGTIDRIDGDGKQLVIYDYKASENSIKSFDKWLDLEGGNLEVQMPFYLWALAHTKNMGLAGQVEALLYYNYNTFRLKGFVVNENAGQTFEVLKDKKEPRFTEEGKREILSSLEDVLVSLISKVEEGQFAPNPADKTKCNDCVWRGMCRAKHLN